MSKITVIGSGSWGRALAKVFAANEIIEGRADGREIKADYVLITVKAQNFREVISKHKFSKNAVLIICSKGIEQGSLELLGEIVEDLLRNEYAILSGPNFADELEQGLPAATTIATKSEEVGKRLIAYLAKPNFRLYYSNDVIATQIGGSVKNVIAIACGITEGLKLGENARAAIITRGIAETSKLVVALGGKTETLMGLGGFGDMILTCTSSKSRNTSFGIEVVKTGNAKLSETRGVVEGYYTAKSVYDLAQKLKIEMPICFSVYEILYKNKNINEVLNDLLKRPQG